MLCRRGGRKRAAVVDHISTAATLSFGPPEDFCYLETKKTSQAQRPAFAPSGIVNLCPVCAVAARSRNFFSDLKFL